MWVIKRRRRCENEEIFGFLQEWSRPDDTFDFGDHRRSTSR